MVWKKFSILLGFLLLGSLFFVPGSTATSTYVIVVSDNPSDYAAAKVASSAMGAPIVTTPWGRFDGDALEKLLSLGPGEVLIIGGRIAVPEKYSETLEEKGIKVTRISGEDRAETSEKVMNWILDNDYKLRGDVYLVDGWDEGSILYILENEENPIILALPHHDLVNAIHEKSGLTDKMASAGTYGRSVYVYPTLVDRDNENSSPCPNCHLMEADEAKAISLSVSRLRGLSGTIPTGEVKSAVLEKASLAEELAAKGEFEKAREVLLEGFGLTYSSIAAGNPGPADTSSGSNG
ncbi:cell wall-binding repeat-containing protein [Thermococcus radiotolerans]|uniref:Cell wall-binding repeat 2 family protein n=1 Tax=Thermococcus radiotolerans TaxID=187880 RepID=A0A2Z2N0L7_9EURY|nr:hypothetical protein [Thermococcus radiotolerans]ASJ13990.1 hypothetical protein A3L10_02150 [Thermococcus radiotolerans]